MSNLHGQVEIQYFWVATHNNILWHRIVRTTQISRLHPCFRIVQSPLNTLTVLVFCGTKPLANCESSSSFVTLKRFMAELEVWLVKRSGVATMGGVARRGKVETAPAPGQSVQTAWTVRASHLSNLLELLRLVCC